jgi:putative FmdB family regulatory protein
MPTYEYQCSACEHRFEQFQSMKDKPLKTCPSCKKAKLERLIGTGGAIIFKGGGFYQTDYRSESYKKSAEADKAPSSASEGSKSDAKSDASASKSADTPAKSEANSPSPSPSAASGAAKKTSKKKAE